MNARKLIAFINQNDHRRDVLSRCQRICSIDRNVLKQDMKARWNTTYSMIECLIKNEEAIQMLPAIDDTLEWPLLSVNDWNHLKDLDKFLSLFKELSLYFSTTAEARMSDLCLDFEFLLADIRLEYLEKKDEISDVLWYAANAAYSKLTKYYTKINTNSFCIATVLDPRFKLGAYGNSQAVVGLKATAELAINEAYRKYSSVAGNNITPTTPTPSMTQPRKKKKFSHLSAGQADELSKYLQDPFASSTCDPLEYWRVNKEEFPILAAMARDYLALQPTFKDVQGYFTTGRLTFPYYGQSLNASTIRNQMLVNFGNNLGVF
ncbi:ribonuclease H-like domain-containing protein [Globomyces pollinis-pini]|nr:ribonuclease H-like domain-containing protein [Globomyces pollinis-pini]